MSLKEKTESEMDIELKMMISVFAGARHHNGVFGTTWWLNFGCATVGRDEGVVWIGNEHTNVKIMEKNWNFIQFYLMLSNFTEYGC